MSISKITFHKIIERIKIFMTYLKESFNSNKDLNDFESCEHFITKNKKSDIPILNDHFNNSHSDLSICFKIYELLLRLKISSIEQISHNNITENDVIVLDLLFSNKEFKN